MDTFQIVHIYLGLANYVIPELCILHWQKLLINNSSRVELQQGPA